MEDIEEISREIENKPGFSAMLSRSFGRKTSEKGKELIFE